MKIENLAVDRLFTYFFVAEEAFFTNTDYTQFSVVELPGFKHWSAYKEERFNGFKIDQERMIISSDSAPKLNYDKLMTLFKSKEWTKEDEQEFEETLNKYGAVYLDGTSLVNKINFTSYLRSGNSLTRKYLEDITGIITGSNMDNRYSRNFALTLCGFKGEVVWDDSVWLYKSHIPNVQGNFTRQFLNKAIICVRNPFDVACSAVQLRLTYTHTLSSKNNIAQEFPEFWDEYLKQTMSLYNNFLDYWTKFADSRQLPVYFFRYEDLISNPEQILREVLEFMLGVESIEGMYIEQRLRKTLEPKKDGKTPIYTPRSGGVIKSMHQYTQKQIDMVLNESHGYLNYFGYSNLLGNLTEAQQDMLREDPFNSFRVSNSEHKAWYLANKAEIDARSGDLIKLLGEESHQVGKTFTQDMHDTLFKLQEKIFVEKRL
jgi:hypothetical protein